jgi:hypothetical protein
MVHKATKRRLIGASKPRLFLGENSSALFTAEVSASVDDMPAVFGPIKSDVCLVGIATPRVMRQLDDIKTSKCTCSDVSRTECVLMFSMQNKLIIIVKLPANVIC